MAKVGQYEVLDELYLTLHGSLCRATRDGVEGSFVVKRFGMPNEDPSEPHWELQTFLDRARVQHSLRPLGARHWAPIHAHGLEDDWAYYATDYHPLTAQKLIDSRLAIKAPALYQIVLGVVAGLSEIIALRNRPHGNLKPGNVLIAGKELLADRVLLTDPASNGVAAREGEPGDVKALGQVIYELVMHRPAAPGQWPLPASAHWGALGSRGDAWRRLCSDLLNPDASARPTLADVGNRLHALRPRRKLPLRQVAGVAAGILLVVGLALAALSTLDHAVRVRYAQVHRDWFGKLVDAVADPRRRTRWQADPDLKRVLDEIPVAGLRGVDLDEQRLIRWNYNEFRDLLEANHSAQAVQNDLTRGWARVSRAQELRARLQDRGWDQPVAWLGRLIDATAPAPGVDVAGGIDHLLLASNTIDAAAKLPDADWKRFTDTIKTIDSVHDPVLSALALAIQKSATSEVKMTDEGLVGVDELKHEAALADKLTDAMQNTWPVNLDRDSFDRDVAKSIDSRTPSKADVDRWLALAALHAYPLEEAAAAAAELRKRMDETYKLITHAHVSAEEAGAFEAQSQEARIAIATLEQTAFTRHTLDDGALVRRRDEVRDRIESLRKYYHPEGPEDWLKDFPKIATSSPRINAYWEAWHQSLNGVLADMQRDHAIFAAKQQASEQLRAVLLSLDQAFPPAPPLPNESFMAAVNARREQAIEKFLPKIDQRAPKLDADAIKAAQGAFEQWTTSLVALSQDFPITKEILTASDRPDQRWNKAKPEFWHDPAVQALVKDDLARIRRLAALDGASRGDLVKAISASSDVETALRAWQLLGAETILPAWPSGDDELMMEYTLRQRLAISFKAVKDPREAEAPTLELAQQAPIRWRRFVENARSEGALISAWKLRTPFGADDAQLAQLSPRARFNLYLSCVRLAAVNNDNAAATQAVGGLSAAAKELKDHPRVAGISGRIARIGLPEAFADRNPGDTFSLALPGAARPVLFKRVEPAAGARPFYLCTTDISVTQFSTALEAGNAWAQARQLPWPAEPGKTDARRGPRTWEWGASSLATPLLWLAPDEYNAYPPAFLAGRFNRMALSDAVGGNPSPDHPMQYISAEAALFYAAACGCRLPTAAEWQAAYAAYESKVLLEKWNLRDQTWEMQRAYVASGGGSRWPDEGIFRPAPPVAPAAAVGRAAASRPNRDGTLYFLPVGVSNAAVFHHLVGNVAQYVCSASDQFEDAPDKKTAEGIRKFVDAAPHSLFVIGGSALSPPEFPVDKPLPVARPDEGYADVGLRLAFTAPSRSLAEKVKWAIGDSPYLWDKSEAPLAGSK